MAGVHFSNDSGWTDITGSYQSYYLGVGCEYQLMASLSRRRYDVMKLPVDYGFDVAARRNLGNKDSYTYYFQVKSVRVNRTEENIIGSRAAYEGSVLVAGYTLDLMMQNPGSALVVYFYDQIEPLNGMETDDVPIVYFWLDGDDIESHSRLFYRKGGEKHTGGYFGFDFRLVYPENDKQSFYIQLLHHGTSEEKQNVRDEYLGSQNSPGEDCKDHFRLTGFFEAYKKRKRL